MINDTLLDVLYYRSPVYGRRLISAVARLLNHKVLTLSHTHAHAHTHTHSLSLSLSLSFSLSLSLSTITTTIFLSADAASFRPWPVSSTTRSAVQHPLPGPPHGPGHSPTVGSWEEVVSCGRGTSVDRGHHI